MRASHQDGAQNGSRAHGHACQEGPTVEVHGVWVKVMSASASSYCSEHDASCMSLRRDCAITVRVGQICIAKMKGTVRTAKTAKAMPACLCDWAARDRLIGPQMKMTATGQMINNDGSLARPPAYGANRVGNDASFAMLWQALLADILDLLLSDLSLGIPPLPALPRPSTSLSCPYHHQPCKPPKPPCTRHQ